MRLWQASLLSAAVHAGILTLPAQEPPARVERKKPREVQLVKLPPPEISSAKKARVVEAHRPGTPGRERPESASTAKTPAPTPHKSGPSVQRTTMAPTPSQRKMLPIQRTVADARRVARSSARLAAAPRHLREAVPPPDQPKIPPPRPREAPPIRSGQPDHPAPPKTTTRMLSAPDGTTVVARLTRVNRSEAPKEAPPVPHHEAELDFALGHPVPLRAVDPGTVGLRQPGEGVFGVGGDVGTVAVTVGNGGGDVSPRLMLIQKRIDSVAALLRSARKDCPGAKGFVRVEFQIQKNGYPANKRLRASSGDPCLEDKAGAVIHLAEPYPYVSGWVPVTMDFN
ncbi:MAG: hypothetical protein GYA21_14175 [Myxococcales bacterium]|nr:hypothetical protein [Myxococcales bacterium]